MVFRRPTHFSGRDAAVADALSKLAASGDTP
jgi:hypothetical protein